MANDDLSIKRLILVPGLITLAVTILRVIGELRHWSPVLFNTQAGGGGALVGISWLPIIFGPYFALKLAREGAGPANLGKAFLFTAVGLVTFVGGAFVFFKAGFKSEPLMLGAALLWIVAFLVPIAGWPALARTLIGYGYAARIPVAIVMYFALGGNWGTHYDGLPPGYPTDVSFAMKYFQTGLVPQLTLWIAFTVIIGSLFGAVAYAVAGRRRVAAPVAP